LIGLARLVLVSSLSSWNVPRSSCYRGHIISLV
jgi:hypothetical protein